MYWYEGARNDQLQQPGLGLRAPPAGDQIYGTAQPRLLRLQGVGLRVVGQGPPRAQASGVQATTVQPRGTFISYKLNQKQPFIIFI